MTAQTAPRHPPARGRLAGALADDDGSGALETVILVPIVLLVLFLSIQAALYSYARSVALTAAQQGLTATRAYDSTAAAGAGQARDFVHRAGGDLLSGTQVSATRGAEQATVTVTGRSLTLVPGLTLRIEQSATGPVERWVE